MELKNAILTIISKQKVVFSAFKQKIVFGFINNDAFVPNQCFEFEVCDFYKIFIGLFQIVKTLSHNSNDVSGIFCQKELETYMWQCNFENDTFIVTLSLKRNDTAMFDLAFNPTEFNDIPRLLSQLMLLSLNLEDKYFKIFRLATECELTRLLKLKDLTQIEDLVLSLCKTNDVLSHAEKYCCSLLIDYHLDVIIAINKIFSFYNKAINSTNEIVNLMENCQ